jgi:hypothetical protein
MAFDKIEAGKNAIDLFLADPAQREYTQKVLRELSGFNIMAQVVTAIDKKINEILRVTNKLAENFNGMSQIFDQSSKIAEALFNPTK